MKNLIITLIIISLAAPAVASTYWCKQNGKTVISNIPCKKEMLQTREIETPQNFVSEEDDEQSQPQVKRQPKTRTVYKTVTVPSKVERKPSTRDYTFNTRVSEKNGRVEASGRIEGPRCDNLRIEVFARTNQGNIINCVTLESLSGNSTTFSCSDRAPRNKSSSSRRDWFVSTITADCR